jgi:hypothetical protein
VDPALEELEVDPNGYRGPYLVLHDKLVDEQVRQDALRRRLCWSRPVRCSSSAFGHMSRKERDVVLAAIT